MPLDVPQELAHVLDQLRRIDEAAVDENGVSQQFLETEKSLNAGEELQINGDRAKFNSSSKACLGGC